MREFILVLCFLNVICLEFVFAPKPEENTSEDNGNDDTLNFYVGPKEQEDKTPSCFGNLFSQAPETKKCSDEDIESFLYPRAQDSPKLVAQGVDGAVFRFTRPDGKVMAVKKRFQKDCQAKKEYLREVNLLQKCKGEGFTANIDCIFQDEQGQYYYMMEYLNGKTLYDGSFYNPQKENFNIKWADICLKMATILVKLNSKKVLHLDIHMGNWIVAPDGRLYIIDFSRAHKSGMLYSKTADAKFLGRTFEDILVSMGQSLGKHLKLEWSSNNELFKKLGSEVDLNGILEITNPLVREDSMERRTVKNSILDLESFLQKHKTPKVNMSPDNINLLARKNAE